MKIKNHTEENPICVSRIDRILKKGNVYCMVYFIYTIIPVKIRTALGPFLRMSPGINTRLVGYDTFEGSNCKLSDLFL